MREVFRSDESASMVAVQILVDQAGIDTVAGTAQSNPWDTGPRVPESSGPWRVWVVRDEDEPRAADIVRRFRSGELKPAPQRPWVCERCGKTIAGQFTECWNCRLPPALDPRGNPEARCCECGYLLWGLPKRRCPECGTHF